MIFTKSGKIVDILPCREKYRIYYQEYVLIDDIGDVVVFSVKGKDAIKKLNIQLNERIAVELEIKTTIYKNQTYNSIYLLQLYRPIGQKTVKNDSVVFKTPKTTKKNNVDDLPL